MCRWRLAQEGMDICLHALPVHGSIITQPCGQAAADVQASATKAFPTIYWGGGSTVMDRASPSRGIDPCDSILGRRCGSPLCMLSHKYTGAILRGMAIVPCPPAQVLPPTSVMQGLQWLQGIVVMGDLGRGGNRVGCRKTWRREIK